MSDGTEKKPRDVIGSDIYLILVKLLAIHNDFSILKLYFFKVCFCANDDSGNQQVFQR